MEEHPFLVGGQWRTSEQINQVRFPYTGEVIGEACEASEQDIEDAVCAAQRGFEKTRQLPAYKRSEILGNLVAEMEKRSDKFTEALILEGGKTRGVAVGEVGRAIETIRVSAEEAKRVGGEIVPIDWTPAGEGRFAIERHVPLGPVLGIVPFNYPLNLGCHKLGPAIAAGNSFIMKPASATPLSSLLLAEAVLEAGYPPEALSVLVCPGSRAETLAADSRIAFLSFTGSSQVGWRLKKTVGRTRVGLELGGNAAVILHDDANVDYAVGRIAVGGFTNAGQNCISVQRVLIQQQIYDETVEKLLAKVKSFSVGDPRDAETDIGPMIDEPAAKKAMAWIKEAIDAGAQILVGGNCSEALLEPTVLANTTPKMSVNREEIFAPVITVAPYNEFDEAIALANNTDYGLQAGIFTQNLTRIMQACDAMEVGGLQVNDVSTFRMDQMPYGGVKGSGVGREGPRYAIEEMSERKLVVINRAGGQL